MTLKLTHAQAKALGLDTKQPTKVRVRKTARGPYHTRCLYPDCGEEFHTAAAEDRHVTLEHSRFELVWGP